MRNVHQFHFEHRHFDIGKVGIDFVRMDCGDNIDVDQVRELPYYNCKVPLYGTCEYRVDKSVHRATAGDIFVSNPMEAIRKRFSTPYAQVLLHVDADHLERVLADECGHPPDAPLCFDPRPVSGTSTKLLVNLVKLLVADLAEGGASQERHVARHCERALLMAMLCSVPNNHSALLGSENVAVAPYYLRRAEAFIRENFREPMNIANIAAAAGVSGRALYYGFKRWRNTSPMAFLKAMRLDHARQELQKTSCLGVTGVAMDVGYNSMGHFSADYRTRFGERPSDTMRRCGLGRPQ